MLTTYVQIMQKRIRQLTLDGMAGGRRRLVNERLRYSTGIMKRLSGRGFGNVFLSILCFRRSFVAWRHIFRRLKGVTTPYR